MATHQENADKTCENKNISIKDYLIRKYGEEPLISEEEMKKNKWNWH